MPADLVPQPRSLAQARPPMEPKLLNTPRPKSRVKKLAKYVVSLGLLWYILHRWLFLLAFNSSTHWAIDPFGPTEKGPSNGQLAENFFL